MGWTFSWHKSVDKKRLIEQLMSGPMSPGYALVEYKVVGNHLWYVYSCPNGSKSIGLYLLQPGGRDEGWGYKDAGENSGIGELDCPIALIEKCDPPQTEFAREWREKVMKLDERKKELKKRLRPGVLISLWEKKYELVEKQKRLWVIRNVESGSLFRLSTECMMHLTILPEHPEQVATPAPAPAPVPETLDLFAVA